MKFFLKTLTLFFALRISVCLSAPVNVLTYHNDFSRTGQNTNETILTPANVNTNSFGRLFSYAVDGQVYGQPLYVSGLAIPGKGTHNVIFVVTQHDSVYAFDADTDGAAGGLLWQASMGTSAITPNNDFGNRYGAYHDIDPEVGITSTPVIDLSSGTIYLEAFTHEGSSYVHRVHALDITTGAERAFSPVVVSASIPGTGVDSSGGVLAFNPIQHLQRPALTLANGILYIAYSGVADTNPYHGWVLGFDASTLQQLPGYVFCTTPNSTTATYGPNAGEGGIWMGGNGLLVDSANNLYFEVGNGVFNVTNSGATEYGDSFIKLSTTAGLTVADYFTPFNQDTLASGDTDVGSGGPLLLPDEVGSVAHPHLIVGAGKEGRIYLIDRDNMGHYNAGSDSQIVQSIPGALHSVFSTPAYFNKTLYYQANGDVMKAYAITNGTISSTPIHRSSTSIGFPGATPSVSANGTNNAIVWVIQSDAYSSSGASGPGVLHAYNGFNLTNELYNSAQLSNRDAPGPAVKTTVPTISNGKVYVGAGLTVSVYANGTYVAPPVISPGYRVFTNSVTVSLSEGTAGASVYFTLDGTTPTTNSILYTNSFVLTNSTVVRAKAFKSGGIPSALLTAAFHPQNGGYEGTVLAAGPVAYWRFNETNGTTAFDTAGGHDAVYGVAAILGVAGPQTPAFPGFESNNVAFRVNGNATWVTAPPLALATNTVTITAWLYPTQNQANYTGLFVSRNGSDASGFNFTTNSQLGYTWNNNSSATYNWMSAVRVPANLWSLAALVVTPTNASVYLFNTNGQLSATNPIAHSAEAFNASAWIGDDMGSASRAFSGIVDEVAVFNYALSPAQLQQLYAIAATTVQVSASVSNGNLILTWPKGTLLQADDVTGPWSIVSSANSPYSIPFNAARKFYRVQVQ